MKKIILLSMLFLSCAAYAQGDTVKYQWPVTPLNSNHGINGTFAEFRNTGSSDHFHNAVDIGEPDGQPVYSSLDGIVHSVVTSIGSNNYVSVRTKVNGKWKRLTYLHISPNPDMYVGKEVSRGVDILGYIYSGMGHVHLIERELVYNTNDYAVEINNLRAGGGLDPYYDEYPPIIHINTVQFKLNETDFNLPANALSNKIDIIVKIEEQNGTSYSHRNNGTFKFGYRIWSADTSAVLYAPSDSGWKYEFMRKPYDSDVHKVYLKGVATLSNPVYILTNGNGASAVNSTRSIVDNYFDTELLEEGDYILEIFSEDTRSNFSNKFIPVTITRDDVVPPGIPELLAIENFDNRKSVRVVYSHNSEPDVMGYRLYYTGNTLLKNWKLAADETELTNEINSYELNSTSDFKEPTEEDVYFFYLTAVDSSGNESSPSDIYSRSSFVNGTNYPKILIVDGFDRYGGSGSWSKPTHSFNTKYFIALTILDSSVVSSASNEAISQDEVDLNKYDMVIWFCGDESTTDRTFTNAEQIKAAAYIENGGNLFVTGSEIGWDLDRSHSGSELSDTLFYRHYLKARFVYDGNSSMSRATGVNGTPFEGLALSFGESYPEDYPDDIDAAYGSVVILNYNQTREDLTTNRHAGVAYKGTFGESSTPGGVVYIAYSVESMGSLSQIVELLGKTWNYFQLTTDISETENNPYDYFVAQNFPNPFNPSTTIRYSIPSFAADGKSLPKTTLKIYDILGREITTLVNDYKKPGIYEVNFNANNLSSGIYIYKLRTGALSLVGKMILLK